MNQVNASTRILGVLTSILALPLRLLLPLVYPAQRIVYLTLAKVRLPNLSQTVQIDGPVAIIGTGNVGIGERSRVSRQVELGTEENGHIKIGENVRINRGSTIFSYTGVTIGDHSLIGEFVTIRDANHGIAPDQTIRSQPHNSERISIGEDVWIGRGVVILPGVTIGDGSVIGANSVVTKDIEPGMIAVGSPAKVIKNR